VHTEYSMLDGLCQIDDLVTKTQAQKQTAVAITDHGNMYGAIPFYNACKKAGIKPIIGCEFYVARRSRLNKQTKMGSDQQHLTLLAKNFTGYQNLMNLVSLAHLEGFSYKPRIDQELLFKHHQGLICLTGCCMQGVFTSLIRAKKQTQALKRLKKYQQVFRDRLYVELQNFPTIKELKKVNPQLIKMARQLNLPLVATNDVHYLEPTDAEAQDALLCVQTRKLIKDQKRLKMVDNPDYYFKSGQQMEELFSDYPEAIKNTIKIANQCELEIPTGQLIFPNYPIAKNETPASALKRMTQAGLKQKFNQITSTHQERIKYELEIINDKGYATYFLITQDFVNWAKDQDISVGPGRGSVAGSLVAYCLGITTMNPLVHELPFERFLNPQRPTPPDIDIDFADNRRDEVIQYAMDKYGSDHVGQVITFGRMEARAAIRDIGRVLGMPYEEPDKIAKLIPNHPQHKVSIPQAVKKVPELSEYYKQKKYQKLLDLAAKVEGTVRHHSVHAAAVVIADKPLPEYTPIQTDSKSGKTITQYDMYALDCNVNDDAIGLLKFDFLGLRNLSIIQETLQLIKKHQNKKLDLDKISLDDQKTFKLLASGETTGIFQLESAGMRRVARSLKPSQFSDITAMLALYRPGPMELIPRFIEGKHKPEKIVYPHPSLKPILQETYGIMVYQEQILQIAHIMAGYSLGEADILRRAIGKKKKKILDKNKKRFIAQAVKKGYDRQVATKVWGFIEAFANYGFNKAHAASYAMIAYQTAYLKANYPLEYMAALMSVESGSHSQNRDKKVAIAVEACKKMNLRVLPPDINQSSDNFTIEPDPQHKNKKAIRFGLNAVKNVGEAAITNILATREQLGEFHSFTQFVQKTDGRKVNKKVLESLIKVGAMDRFGTRASMLENLEKIRQTAAQYQSEVDGQDNLFAKVATKATKIKDTFKTVKEYPHQELLSFEKELLGFYLTDHPMAEALKTVTNKANKQIAELDKLIHQDHQFWFGGVITKLRQIQTKKGQPMAFGTLEDQTGAIDFVIFPRVFQRYGELAKLDQVVLVKAKVNERNDELQLVITKISVPTAGEIKQNTNHQAQEIFVPRKTSKKVLQQLGDLLKAHPGKQKIIVVIPNGARPKKMLLPYRVNWNKKLAKQVKKLLE
ncbi:MAG: DNA polymerase III subunit alpha, partial [Candidatus Pacebacteria bacterium]|nr:DNA polymerase III subunit alpha [Candidatus Paceibacterota bacterium]